MLIIINLEIVINYYNKYCESSIHHISQWHCRQTVQVQSVLSLYSLLPTETKWSIYDHMLFYPSLNIL